MRGGAHLAIGAGSTALGLYGLQALGAPLDPLTIAFGAMAAGLGALAPDVDHPRSTASSSLPDKLVDQAIQMALPILLVVVAFTVFGGKAVGASMMASFGPLLKIAGTMLAFAIAFVLASKVARRYTKHRGATHSLFMAAGATLFVTVACLIASVPAWYGLLFGWGWLTHLGADATTKMGVPSLLWFPHAQGAAVSTTTKATPIPVREPMSRPTPVSTTVDPLAAAASAPAVPVVEPVIPVCPTCGIPMVLRTARRGAQQGNRFYGCANYPACRQTKPA